MISRNGSGLLTFAGEVVASGNRWHRFLRSTLGNHHLTDVSKEELMLQKLTTAVAVAGAIALGAAYSAHAAPAGVPALRGVAADTVTGCLKKGDKKDVYSVTDASGKKHWVTSASVPLSNHVGHTVTLVGEASGDNMMGDKMSDNKMSDNKMGNDTGMKMSGGMKMGPMNVTSLSMVSASCK